MLSKYSVLSQTLAQGLTFLDMLIKPNSNIYLIPDIKIKF